MNMTITLSHGGPTIYTSTAPSDRVLVGTMKGIVVLERDGDGWHEVDRVLTDLHIHAICIEPESGLIFAGAKLGSLHASADGGKTWALRDNGLTEKDIYSIATSKINGTARMFVGTEPAHLFHSDDLGEHWTDAPNLRTMPSLPSWTFPPPPHVAHLKHINFDPTDPSVVYASIEQGALLKSVDGGENWQEISGMDPDVHRTIISSEDGKTMFCTGGDGIYASVDGGETWEHRTTNKDDQIGGYPDQLVFAPSNRQIMFISGAQRQPGSWRDSHFAGGRISRSNDGGKTWEPLTGGLPDRLHGSVEAMCLEDCGGVISLFAATTQGEVFHSANGGGTWAQIASDLAPITKGGHYRFLAPTGA
jgi:photosystem II stability/assembly factor-like uncharacterized protein